MRHDLHLDAGVLREAFREREVAYVTAADGIADEGDRLASVLGLDRLRVRHRRRRDAGGCRLGALASRRCPSRRSSARRRGPALAISPVVRSTGRSFTYSHILSTALKAVSNRDDRAPRIVDCARQGSHRPRPGRTRPPKRSNEYHGPRLCHGRGRKKIDQWRQRESPAPGRQDPVALAALRLERPLITWTLVRRRALAEVRDRRRGPADVSAVQRAPELAEDLPDASEGHSSHLDRERTQYMFVLLMHALARRAAAGRGSLLARRATTVGSATARRAWRRPAREGQAAGRCVWSSASISFPVARPSRRATIRSPSSRTSDGNPGSRSAAPRPRAGRRRPRRRAGAPSGRPSTHVSVGRPDHGSLPTRRTSTETPSARVSADRLRGTPAAPPSTAEEARLHGRVWSYL